MSSVFLSYSRNDLSVVEDLIAQLKKASDVSIWRDQEKLYGGDNWPKILGEAIADQDAFLLVWSKSSADSHFVEFEWTTALALKKKIIPCLLDSTTLPASLAAPNALPVDDIPKIIASLTAVMPPDDVQRRAEVVGKLGEITTTKPELVLKSAKKIFDQRNWVVHGNVIQGENVTVTIGPRAEDTRTGLLEKWQTWATLLVTILTAIGFAVDLPGKLGFTLFSPAEKKERVTEEHVLDQPLAGQVVDVDTPNLEPVADAQVSLLDFDQERMTDKNGHFRFDKVRATKQKSVKFTVRKDCYRVETYQATLGNTDLRPPLSKSGACN